MKYVTPLASGLWRHAPFHPSREWERLLVLALEHGTWGVNRAAVKVFPGMIVAFDEAIDAEFFLRSERGLAPIVTDPNAGQVFAFADDEIARYFVSQGLAEHSNQQAFDAFIAGQQPEPEIPEDDMQTLKPKLNVVSIETKTITPKATAPKRAPAPAKAAKAKAK
jgi:hypothetical protein